MPVLEAMACGCPVVAASGSSLDEIAGPAVRVNPHDPLSIAQGIVDVLGLTKIQREALIGKGFAWVKQFSWQKVARETVASYEKALERI